MKASIARDEDQEEDRDSMTYCCSYSVPQLPQLCQPSEVEACSEDKEHIENKTTDNLTPEKQTNQLKGRQKT